LIAAPELTAGTAFPPASAALAGAFTMAMLLFLLTGEIWNVAVAKAPSGMGVWFSPQATQVAAEIP
jgi:hypothetical protein